MYCLTFEGCVSEAMVDGLARFLSMGVWLSRSGDTALLQLKHKKLATILTHANESGPDTVYTAKRSNDQNLKSVSENYHSICI